MTSAGQTESVTPSGHERRELVPSTSGGTESNLFTYQHDINEGWPGALLRGKLEIQDSCVVLISGSDVHWAALPNVFRLEGDSLVAEGFERIPLGVPVEIGGGELRRGAFDQLSVRDPMGCSERGGKVLLVPQLSR